MKQVYLVMEQDRSEEFWEPVMAFADYDEAEFFANKCLSKAEVRYFPFVVDDEPYFDNLNTTTED